MSEMDTTRTITLLRALSLVLSLLAVAGWGAFAYVAASSAEAKQRLNEQVAELKRGQEQLTAERNQAKAEVVTLRASRDQLVADVQGGAKSGHGSGGNLGHGGGRWLSHWRTENPAKTKPCGPSDHPRISV